MTLSIRKSLTARLSQDQCFLLFRGNIGAQVVVGYQGETQSYIDYWVMQRQLSNTATLE